MNEVANKKSDREVWIDIVKGIAIVMVVWQHTCQRTKTYFSLEDDPLLNFLNLIVADVNMPIFFAISGYVYFLKREKYLGDIRRFIKTRFYDLIIPYLIFGPMIWLGKFLLTAFVRDPMTINDLFRMFYVPIAFMWFIYVLFFIEVITILLDKFAKGKELIVLGFMLIPSFFISQGKTVVSLTLTFLFWYYSGSLILLAKNRIAPPHCEI